MAHVPRVFFMRKTLKKRPKTSKINYLRLSNAERGARNAEKRIGCAKYVRLRISGGLSITHIFGFSNRFSKMLMTPSHEWQPCDH